MTHRLCWARKMASVENGKYGQRKTRRTSIYYVWWLASLAALLFRYYFAGLLVTVDATCFCLDSTVFNALLWVCMCMCLLFCVWWLHIKGAPSESMPNGAGRFTTWKNITRHSLSFFFSLASVFPFETSTIFSKFIDLPTKCERQGWWAASVGPGLVNNIIYLQGVQYNKWSRVQLQTVSLITKIIVWLTGGCQFPFTRCILSLYTRHCLTI